MELNEIKKALYKQKPLAVLATVSKIGILYSTILEDFTSIPFIIPFEDIGDAIFSKEMEAQHLIRWMVKPEV